MTVTKFTVRAVTIRKSFDPAVRPDATTGSAVDFPAAPLGPQVASPAPATQPVAAQVLISARMPRAKLPRSVR